MNGLLREAVDILPPYQSQDEFGGAAMTWEPHDVIHVRGRVVPGGASQQFVAGQQDILENAMIWIDSRGNTIQKGSRVRLLDGRQFEVIGMTTYDGLIQLSCVRRRDP